jgi:NADPH-dependent 2,4-dienoyl-CoA reductase/sulfur reductase-like enzyme
MPERLVVIGGDAAGMSAASQARRRRNRRDLEIVAFERGRHVSYSACGIPYWIGGEVARERDLIARDVATFADEYGIDVKTNHEVVGLDLSTRTVSVRQVDIGVIEPVAFDQVVMATGAVPVRPDLPGLDAPGVFGVQTLDDGERVRAAVDEGARRAVVVGGGYVGLEMAEAMARRGLEVTLVEAAPEPMSTLDTELGAMVREAMTGMGIAVRTGEKVVGVEVGQDGRAVAVRTADTSYPADLVVLGLGVRPDTALAAAAGLPLGETGGIRVDHRMRVLGEDGVWAAGDCVETRHLVGGHAVHVPLGTHANKQGRVIGINLGGGYATFPGVLGTAVTKVCDLEIGRTGLGEAEARRIGFQSVAATITSTSAAGYLPEPGSVTIKLVAERRTGRLLGGQIVGRGGAAKRVDVLATAITAGMTVEEMISLDLGYAPPFSPLWDPVLVAARKTAEAVESAEYRH